MTASVTIGMPVANGERYFAEALDSVRAQTLGDLEILVADNGSTDATQDICRAAMREDPRIVYLRSEQNRGGPWNMNRLFQRAAAPYFKWAFYDDLVGPTLVEDCYRTLTESIEPAVLAHARVRTIDASSAVTGEHDDADLGVDAPAAHDRLRALYVSNAEQTLFGVIRTEALRRTAGIRRTVSDGHLLLTELILQGPFLPVAAQSQLMRLHDGQHGGDRESEMRWLGAGPRDRVFAYTRVTGRLVAAVRRSDLPPVEKARCLAVIGRHWTLRTWRSSASDVVHLLDDLRPRA